jgi:hypothetical protein
LSQPGRIVIAATEAADESNETEFPHGLATTTALPFARLDADKDQRVSVGELFSAVVAEVERRFKSDNRIATEHAQLDDNGDGRGSEALTTDQADPQSASAKIDGDLANKTYLPLRPE